MGTGVVSREQCTELWLLGNRLWTQANLGAIYSKFRQLKTDIPGVERTWIQYLFRGSLWLLFRI